MNIFGRWMAAACVLGLSLPCLAEDQTPTPAEVDKVFESFTEAWNAIEVNPYKSGEYVRPSAEEFEKLRSSKVKNWQVLFSDIDRLPVSTGGPSKATTLSLISEACEALPPVEYLDMLDRLLDLTAEKKIPAAIVLSRINGYGSKDHFIAVNYEHPRVKQILERAKAILGDSKESLAELDGYSEGRFADNYERSESDGIVYPETLPGIELKRPFASLIKKYEQITGKKVPPDPKFDPRPTRRGEAVADPAARLTKNQTSWSWRALAITLLVSVVCIWKFRVRICRQSS